MNNEGLQAIIGALVLLALLLIGAIPFVLFIGYTVLQKRKRDQIREALLREHQPVIGNHQSFPVRYASELRFKSLFKVFPWEGAGILVTVPGSALLLVRTLSGSSLTLQFAPGNSTLNWVGKAPWPNGAVSWFYFATTTEKHYLTSETGLLVLGSAKSTRAVFDEINKSFLAHSAPRV